MSATMLGVAPSALASEGPYELVERMADVLVYVEEAYVDPVERSRLLDGAITGMVAELDPHSAYLTPAQFAQFVEDTQGEFAGLGVEVDFRDDRVTVIATMPGSPAEQAGILPGDRIVAVDSSPIAGTRAEAIIRRMRGPVGTQIRLTIEREGNTAPLHMTLTRAIVVVPSVEAKLLEHSIAYVRLKSFQEGCYVELVEQIAGLRRKQPLAGIILDLRGNPGGLVSEAIAIADEFLDHGVIYSARHRGRVVETVVSQTGDLLEKIPLVVLVGAGTASSAEIVSGALQDRGRATLVGEPTFGKGSVQNVIELSGGAGLLLTTLRYFTPKGRAIQARGLIPSVLVKSDAADSAIREADISGHLHGEGSDAGAPSVPPDANAAARTSGEQRTQPVGSEEAAAAHEEATPAQRGARRPIAPERVPIAALPVDPTRHNDPVLARGYAMLREQIASATKAR
jgi:carboxyl-terminal processing protease